MDTSVNYQGMRLYTVNFVPESDMTIESLKEYVAWLDAVTNDPPYVASLIRWSINHIEYIENLLAK